MEKLREELIDQHDLQWGDLLFELYGWLMVHRPDAREEYIDGGHPVFIMELSERNKYMKADEAREIKRKDNTVSNILSETFVLIKEASEFNLDYVKIDVPYAYINSITKQLLDLGYEVKVVQVWHKYCDVEISWKEYCDVEISWKE